MELGRRLASVDVLRGFATLGIFPMNVLTGFALVMAAFNNPSVAGGFEGINYLLWSATHTLFDTKMMTIFSALFGAGLVLMDQRSEQSGRAGFGEFYYRRIGALTLIGLVHAYVFWFGDILFMYALCGLVLYPARKLQPQTLLALGACLVFVGACMNLLWGSMYGVAGVMAVEDPSVYMNMFSELGTDSASIANEVAERSGSLGSLIQWNAIIALIFHLVMIPMFIVWRVLGVMLIGAALMKLGVFAAERSPAFYTRMIALGYGLGVPIVLATAAAGVQSEFDPAISVGVTMTGNYIGSLFVAAGHIGLVMLICCSGVLLRVQIGLSAVGRLALTNYLTQTVIGLGVFSAWGLGLINQWERWQLWLFVLAVWALQIIFSILWTRRFRFGPAEWLWRSMTYWKPQPMLRDVTRTLS